MASIPQLNSFQNQFLVAMPALDDEYFGRSVTYILEHNNEGAMGIVINQPAAMSFKELISQADEGATVDDDKLDKIVVCGGPVHQDRGFVLHSTQAGYNSSLALSSEIMVTTSKDILSVVGNKAGPAKSVIALGYAGWAAGQLEQEVQNNAWLTLEADQEILFDTPIHKKWQAAVNKLGVDVWQLTQQAGHA